MEKKYKIAFLSNKLTLRGCEVALYNYAHYNETILNNSSIIITRDIEKLKGSADVHPDAYKKFRDRFPVFYYENKDDVEKILKSEECDIVFIEKAGSPTDNLWFDSCKNIIHSVFTLEEPHGDAYTSLSEWLNIHHHTNYPVIPYMVDIHQTTDNLRRFLNIPEDALVFGTYSGAECFNIDYVIQCVKDIVNQKKHPNIYFIFMNIKPFMESSEHIRFLEGTHIMEYKRMFINTCDAMLYGRDKGETFGLACGEFSLCDKPIIGRSKEHSASHLHILGDTMIKHNNYDELYDILTNYNKYKIDVTNNNYKKYTPEYAMTHFKSVCDSLFIYNESLKVYFHGFWSGFFDHTNPVHVDFFKKLLEKVFEKEIILGSRHDSDILFETVFEPSIVKERSWKYKFLFCGESKLLYNTDDYDIVFNSKQNEKNIVNMPEFIPYIYCNYPIDWLESKHLLVKEENKSHIPIVSIISNSSFPSRNWLLSYLLSHIPVVNFGTFMNNIGGVIPFQYNSKEFSNLLKQFHFVVAFENSIDDTYITEKIFHALIADTIPIYFGSNKICDYINKERILIIEKSDVESINKVINQIIYLLNNKEEYDKKIRQPIFTNSKLFRTVESIIKDTQYLLFNKNYKLDRTFCISSKKFEPDRYNRLTTLFSKLKLSTEFIQPTYKHTITEEIYNKYVKTDDIFNLRSSLLKKAELSISLNFLNVFQHICKNYSKGHFLILESDVYLHGNTNDINNIIDTLNEHNPIWDCVHIGFDKPNVLNNFDYTKDSISIKRKFNPRCLDSMIWSYNGVIKFLNYLEKEILYDFSIPFDYIVWNFFKTHKDFYFYWCNNEVFIQGSNAGIEASTIQND
jgi:hypothetical protein